MPSHGIPQSKDLANQWMSVASDPMWQALFSAVVLELPADQEAPKIENPRSAPIAHGPKEAGVVQAPRKKGSQQKPCDDLLDLLHLDGTEKDGLVGHHFVGTRLLELVL